MSRQVPHRATSLPSSISEDIVSGRTLVGDNYSPEQISRWFAQEKEAFYGDDAGNSFVDPYYEYMRTLTCRLGSVAVRTLSSTRRRMLVLGPGPGLEVQDILDAGAKFDFTFVEASDNFRRELAERYPGSEVLPAVESGDVHAPAASIDVVLALSVLHHVPNVSHVINEFSRILKPGGYAIIREPCSSMGDWRYARSATPNERGISKRWMVAAASRAGLQLAQAPVPILFHPLSLLVRKLRLAGLMKTRLYYWADASISRLLTFNDHYWRDTWFKRLGPSCFFYVLRKPLAGSRGS